MYLELALLALFAFLYSLISGKVDRLPISGPVIFVLVGAAFGPLWIGWFESDVGRADYKVLVDLTLVLVLFTDAAGANLSVLRRQWQLPARLLVIGLPGAIGLGFIAAAWLFEALSIYEAAILGTMLAATDAALGKAVVTNEAVPAGLREGLNCESGLNDGLCVPFLLLFITLASGDEGEPALLLVAQELGVGALVGLVIAGSGAWLLAQASRRGWVSAVWLQSCVPALAFSCFAIAQTLDASGYIAAFVGGMLFGSLLKEEMHALVMPAEGVSETMAMLTWLIFGAVAISQSIEHMTWSILLYALLSLTVIRMVPVFLSLVGSGVSADARLFLGWFGPRGLASIVFAIMVLNVNLPNAQFMAMVVTCTVGISLLVHGVSANPLSGWMAGRQSQTTETG